MALTRPLDQQADDALQALGRNLREARIRRGLDAATVAHRAGISAPTLTAIEHGRSGIGARNVARVLAVLGLLDQLTQIASRASDAEGTDAVMERLPQRVYKPRRKYVKRITSNIA